MPGERETSGRPGFAGRPGATPFGSRPRATARRPVCQGGDICWSCNFRTIYFMPVIPERRRETRAGRTGELGARRACLRNETGLSLRSGAVKVQFHLFWRERARRGAGAAGGWGVWVGGWGGWGGGVGGGWEWGGWELGG